MGAMKYTQQIDLELEVLDANERPAHLDGVPAWENSNLDAAELIVSDDGKKATLKGKNTGAGQLKVLGDAKMGEEHLPIVGTYDYEVLGGEATIIRIKASDPVEQ